MPTASVAAALISLGVATGAATGPTVLFRLQDPALEESSGLAVSQRHDGVVWSHPDGGDVAEVMAVDGRGRTLATVRLRGVDPYDPEALAPGSTSDGRPALFLGDIGDNRARRPDISVFRFAEPQRLTDQTVGRTWWKLRYPDGPKDAEALLVDPRDGRLWIATKDVFGGRLDRAPGRLRTDRVNLLERVGDVPGLVTDGAFLPDGRFVLRSYTMAYLYDGPDQLSSRALLPDQPQGESVAVDGDRLLVGSEGAKSAVYSVPLPGSDPGQEPSASTSTSASGSGSTPAAETGNRTRPDDGVSWAAVGLSLLGAAVVAAALARLLRGRSRPRR
jgi:hypothetical protein